MKAVVAIAFVGAVAAVPALAQQDREARDPGSRQIEQEGNRYSGRHAERERRYQQGVTKVGEPNPYEPKVGAPNPYATQGGTPNPYATQGGTPDPYATQGGSPANAGRGASRR